jgi:hypothetical protein
MPLRGGSEDADVLDGAFALATAGIVYQDTAATAQATYLGQTGTLALTVKNVGTRRRSAASSPQRASRNAARSAGVAQASAAAKISCSG